MPCVYSNEIFFSEEVSFLNSAQCLSKDMASENNASKILIPETNQAHTDGIERKKRASDLQHWPLSSSLKSIQATNSYQITPVYSSIFGPEQTNLERLTQIQRSEGEFLPNARTESKIRTIPSRYWQVHSPKAYF